MNLRISKRLFSFRVIVGLGTLLFILLVSYNVYLVQRLNDRLGTLQKEFDTGVGFEGGEYLVATSGGQVKRFKPATGLYLQHLVTNKLLTAKMERLEEALKTICIMVDQIPSKSIAWGINLNCRDLLEEPITIQELLQK